MQVVEHIFVMLSQRKKDIAKLVHIAEMEMLMVLLFTQDLNQLLL